MRFFCRFSGTPDGGWLLGGESSASTNAAAILCRIACSLSNSPSRPEGTNIVMREVNKNHADQNEALQQNHKRSKLYPAKGPAGLAGIDGWRGFDACADFRCGRSQREARRCIFCRPRRV